jgi:dihydrofolate synthase/folylpolyglutamate synthase
MGGRLDATNITPLVSVITNIGLDHMQFLGQHLNRLHFEKAGIIKPNIPIIIGGTLLKPNLLLVKAKECNSEIIC